MAIRKKGEMILLFRWEVPLQKGREGHGTGQRGEAGITSSEGSQVRMVWVIQVAVSCFEGKKKKKKILSGRAFELPTCVPFAKQKE